MTRTARERLARLLDDSEPAGSFSAQLAGSAEVLGLEVSGVGPVRLPVRAPLARKLIAVARPAMFGRAEQTLTDVSVRDTWEITPDRITLGGSGWAALMERALEQFRDELGLPRNSRLRADLHSMLVYGKGQFFLPHKDSEKDDAMVGTLVVSLPSAHSGGELVIDHAGQSKIYRASKQELTLVAFYADCPHQVTPVRSGHRVTLTFNLLSTSEAAASATDPAAELVHCLTEHFTKPAASRYGSRDLPPPNRLVYLLDHEYTQRGLSWRRLKGADAERARLMRAAADRAGCESMLALAEVKETWDAEPAGYARRDYDDDYHEVEDEARVDFELNDLIDDEVTLGWWTKPDGTSGELISLRIRDDEVCAATPNADLLPYRSEYEGYMGNYGNTLDRWYRRAAVVVWPRDRAFAARAEAGSRWAMDELRDRIEAGDLDGARAAAQSLAPFWKRVGTRAELLAAALGVAAGLDAARTAAMLQEPFHIETLAAEHADVLAAAAGRYGEDWTRSVVDGWFGPDHRDGPDLWEWVDNSLPGLCEALRAACGADVARLLVSGAWRKLDGRLRFWIGYPQADHRRPQLANLSSPLVSLLGAADDALREEIAGALRGYRDHVLECLMPALRLANARQAAGLDAIAPDCEQRLGTIITRPPRADDDWSIDWTGCGCGLCDTLGTFLGSGSRQALAWPLAADGRRHLHNQIDAAGLPVHHQTRRQGSPYTMVLTKTDEVFTRASTARGSADTDLVWLRSTWFGSSVRT